VTKQFLEYLGFEPERYHTAWISGSEGQKFADIVTRVVEDVRKVGPSRKMRDAR
jgi:coenzyme F420-reducing hydrogenase delta subunit